MRRAAAAHVHLDSDFRGFHSSHTTIWPASKPLYVNAFPPLFGPLRIGFAYRVYDLQKLNSPQNTSNTWSSDWSQQIWFKETVWARLKSVRVLQENSEEEVSDGEGIAVRLDVIRTSDMQRGRQTAWQRLTQRSNIFCPPLSLRLKPLKSFLNMATEAEGTSLFYLVKGRCFPVQTLIISIKAPSLGPNF